MNDRRDNARRRTAAYHLVYELETGEFVGRVINLTTGGLRLISDAAVAVPTKLSCRMRLPDLFKGAREIMFDIESRWCEYNRIGDWYETGYEFVRLGELARQAIDAMIRDWPRETPPAKTR
ncbi:MAG: PilZ domain-containing protein [candidate division Zixibacteria bacterium]|nr:PilZ domain-containing protein [candidate division Zixibacteria bacterium]